MTLFLTIYALIAISVAIVGVIGMFIASRGIDRYGSNGVLTFYLWMVLLAPTVRLLTAPREYLTESDATLAGYTAIAGWVGWALRLSSLSIVGVAITVIVMALIKRQKQQGATFLIVGLFAVVFSMITSVTLGEKPAFIYQNFYPVLLMTSLLLMPRIEPEQVAIQAKRVLFVLMVGSLVLAAIFPSRFAEMSYVGIIPGFHIRLHGLAPHANSLAPLALLYLVLSYWVRGKNPWHFLGVASALLVLVLTQSKTVWGAGLLMLFVVAVVKLNRQFTQEMKVARVGWATLVTLGAFLGGAALLPLLFTDLAGGLFHALMADSGVSTLTGRTDIWQTTIDTWRNNPWFGYGPKLWDVEFRITHGAVLAAWHAHNQYLQALGEAGIVGLAAVLIYTVALIYYGFKFAGRTRGASLALLLLLLVRTITEIPLRLTLLLDTTYFVHLVVFTIFLMLSRQSAAGEKSVEPPAATAGQLARPA
ncbi:O-antigen ligase family protein [Thiobacillus sp.]|uniref:O-antigen ligase family protein n=1 Tax=Thiobacillus sp. TaxID=924 RepID=UPI0025EB18EF|nr:O-antigen ligase family protein [Thiobacillus sp.]